MLAGEGVLLLDMGLQLLGKGKEERTVLTGERVRLLSMFCKFPFCKELLLAMGTGVVFGMFFKDMTKKNLFERKYLRAVRAGKCVRIGNVLGQKIRCQKRFLAMHAGINFPHWDRMF